MCMTCGCKKIGENHNDQNNIAKSNIENAATSAQISVKTAIDNLREGLDMLELEFAYKDQEENNKRKEENSVEEGSEDFDEDPNSIK